MYVPIYSFRTLIDDVAEELEGRNEEHLASSLDSLDVPTPSDVSDSTLDGAEILFPEADDVPKSKKYKEKHDQEFDEVEEENDLVGLSNMSEIKDYFPFPDRYDPPQYDPRNFKNTKAAEFRDLTPKLKRLDQRKTDDPHTPDNVEPVTYDDDLPSRYGVTEFRNSRHMDLVSVDPREGNKIEKKKGQKFEVLKEPKGTPKQPERDQN